MSIEQKVKEWFETTNWIIETREKKRYLTNENNSKRRLSPEEGKAALNVFLQETEWFIRKCGSYDTQSVESFNSFKADICPKGNAFGYSFRMRCFIAILKWNDIKYFKIFDSILLNDKLALECEEILDKNCNEYLERRNKSQEVHAKIIRNIKRRNKRIKNRIKAEGHQYKGENKITRHNPNREVAF